MRRRGDFLPLIENISSGIAHKYGVVVRRDSTEAVPRRLCRSIPKVSSGPSSTIRFLGRRTSMSCCVSVKALRDTRTRQSPTKRADGVPRRGGDGRGHEVVARVRQRCDVLGQSRHEVVHAERALVEDPAERRRLRKLRHPARPLPHALGDRCAEVRRAQRHHVGDQRRHGRSSPGVATAPAARMTRPPIECPTSAIRVTSTRPRVDEPLQQRGERDAVLGAAARPVLARR